MKTTVELPDELFREAKELAQRQRITLRELVIEGLQDQIDRRRAPAPQVDFVFRTFGGDGLAPDVDPGSLTDRAYDLPPL